MKNTFICTFSVRMTLHHHAYFTGGLSIIYINHELSVAIQRHAGLINKVVQ